MDITFPRQCTLNPPICIGSTGEPERDRNTNHVKEFMSRAGKHLQDGKLTIIIEWNRM